LLIKSEAINNRNVLLQRRHKIVSKQSWRPKFGN